MTLGSFRFPRLFALEPFLGWRAQCRVQFPRHTPFPVPDRSPMTYLMGHGWPLHYSTICSTLRRFNRCEYRGPSCAPGFVNSCFNQPAYCALDCTCGQPALLRRCRLHDAYLPGCRIYVQGKGHAHQLFGGSQVGRKDAALDAVSVHSSSHRSLDHQRDQCSHTTSDNPCARNPPGYPHTTIFKCLDAFAVVAEL